MTIFRKSLYLGLTLGVLLSSFSCEKDTGKVGGEYLGEFEVDQVVESEGILTYSSGTAFVTTAGETKPLSIGAILKSGDTIETEAESYCEIQFGEASVVRVDELTILEISSLIDNGKKTETDLTLAKGALLCKVEKLVDDKDSFKVKTDTAVCGVRGTQFGVTKGSGDMKLTVKEGRVAVSSPQVDQLRDTLREDGTKGDFIDTIEESSVFVAVSEEVLIADDSFDVSDTQAEKVLSNLKKDGAANLDTDLVSLSEDFQKDSNVLKKNRGALSEESIANLDNTDDMKIVSLKNIRDDKVDFYKVGFVAQPQQAKIIVNGYSMGRSFSRVYEAGDKLIVEVSAEGYVSQTRELIVADDVAKLFNITLDPVVKEATEDVVETSVKVDDAPVMLNLSLTPQDGKITIDGKDVGMGSFSGEFDNGASVTVSFSRNGYKTEERTVSVGDGNDNLSIDLQPQPIEKRFAVSPVRGVGEMNVSGTVVSYVDAGGVIHGVNVDNGGQFSLKTANVPNENTPLVRYGNYLYFSGVAELVVANANTGSVINRVPLSADMVHIFGRRPTPAGNSLLYPGNRNLHVMDLTGNPTDIVPIPGGSKMSAAVWNGQAVIGDQAGNMLLVDIVTGETTASIPTQATQGLAIAPAVYGNIAVMTGRHGIVSAVDLINKTVLWNVNIGGLGYDSISVGASGCYIYMGNSIIGLSWAGGYLFPAIAGASCAPLVHNETLYYGTANGKFIVADAGTGRALRMATLGVPVECRPVALAGNKFAVKAGGELMLINPEGMVE